MFGRLYVLDLTVDGRRWWPIVDEDSVLHRLGVKIKTVRSCPDGEQTSGRPDPVNRQTAPVFGGFVRVFDAESGTHLSAASVRRRRHPVPGAVHG
ncbi:hypothetical protein VB773_02465 [Haloarculaceae archaeon H-GB2-1]|nr:hypothetical protein [Haloarculaceae archaeon H-GB1-1]MEA5406555.1 hypothetical protein [Haloarculaceae archaeon H-GB2-1]